MKAVVMIVLISTEAVEAVIVVVSTEAVKTVALVVLMFSVGVN